MQGMRSRQLYQYEEGFTAEYEEAFSTKITKFYCAQIKFRTF